MKTLRKIQKNMIAMGFTPKQQQQNNDRKLSSYQIIVITVLSIDIITHCVFFFYGANGLEECTETIFLLTGKVGIFAAFISIIFKTDDLSNNIELFSKEITDRSDKNPASRAIHKKTNRIVKMLNKFVFYVGVHGGCIIAILPKGIVSYCIYYTTDSGSDAFDLPLLTWFPFDWKNPYGYLVAVIWQSIVTVIIVRFMFMLLLPLALDYFCINLSFVKDWKGDLRTLNEMVKIKQSEANIYTQVAEFIRSHSNVRQLNNDLQGVYEVSVSVDFMCGIITQCALMLMFQVEILSKHTIDSEVLWKLVSWETMVLTLVFLPCEFGQRLTDAFDETTDRIEQLDWYLYPNKIQQMLPTIIINTHEPIVLECFGIVNGSRDQFKKVVNIVYKTFNALRQIFN